MKRFLLPALLAGASFQAQAVGTLADIAVVDRDTGQALHVYSHRGEYWVAGKPGARYSIRVRNQTGERLLAIPSVDGVNIITGDTASWNQSGYVYSPWQSYELTGWRKSDTEVAAFEFTAEPNSYASRTGRPKNVGVIGVALFRERQPVAIAEAMEREDRPSADAATSAEESRQAGALPVPAPSARSEAKDSAVMGKMARAREPKLGTGHGAREGSVVEATSFERLQELPNEMIHIRYDSRTNLVAMGVIRKPWRPNLPTPRPEPFPDSAVMGYVPDPPTG